MIADTVQFLGSRDGGDSPGGGGNQFVPAGASTQDADFGGGGSDDDIPF